jgi:hypothetical protein
MTYTVKSGDSLSLIAKNLLGDVNAWQSIYNLNSDVIGNNPADIQVGMVLEIPDTSTTAAPDTSGLLLNLPSFSFNTPTLSTPSSSVGPTIANAATPAPVAAKTTTASTPLYAAATTTPSGGWMAQIKSMFSNKYVLGAGVALAAIVFLVPKGGSSGGSSYSAPVYSGKKRSKKGGKRKSVKRKSSKRRSSRKSSRRRRR